MLIEEYIIEQKAVKTYGKMSQLIVAIEELSELIKELTKCLRCEDNVDHISEEMADVYIMLDQLRIMFNNDYSIAAWKLKKLRRLNERIRQLHNSGSDK